MLNTIPEIYLLPLKTSPTPFVYLNNQLECLYANEAFHAFFNFTEDTQEETWFFSETLDTSMSNAHADQANEWFHGINLLTLIPQPAWLNKSAPDIFKDLQQRAKEHKSAELNCFFIDIFNQNQYIVLTLHHLVHEGQDLYACHIEEVDDHSNFIRRADYGITQYRDFIESMPLFAHVWDENFNLIDCGDEIKDLFDCEDKEAYLDNFLKFSPEYQANGILSKTLAKEKLQEALKEGKVTFEWTHLNPKKGELIPCEITLARVIKDGEILVVGYLNDRRQYFRDQVEINKAYEMFQLMRDTMPIASFLFTPDYKMIDCNKAIETLLGTTKEDYLENYRKYIPEYQPDGQHSFEKGHAIYKEAMDNGSVRLEWIFKDIHGEEVPTDLTLHRINYRGQDMLAAFASDLREAKAYVKQLKKQMQEQQTRDKIILDSLPIGAVYWDENGEIMDCNQTMLKLFKVPSVEYYKEHFEKFIPKKETVGYANNASIPDLLKESFSNHYIRTEYMRLDNEQKPLFVDVTAVRLEQDGKPFVAVYTMDLTEKKTQERQLREESERIQLMFDAFPMSAKLWDENLHILDCNMEAIRTLRYDSKSEYLQYANKLDPNNLPADRRHYQAFFSKVRETFQTGYSRFEWTTKDKFRQAIPTEVTCIRVKHDDELTVISYLRDLRDQKKMMAKMQEASEHVQLMFDAFPMSAKLFDKDLRILDCNLEAIRTLRYDTKEEYLQYANKLNPANLPPERTHYSAFFSKIHETFETGFTQFEWATKDKFLEEIPTAVTCIRVKRDNGFAVIAYLRDLREQKKMLENIRVANERMRLMFNTFPMGANFWNRDLHIIDCNLEVVKLSGFDSKEEYLNWLTNLTSHLAEGDDSGYDTKILEIVEKTFKTGYEQIEWVTKHKDGYTIPVERTFIREQNTDGEDVIIGYMRDLREQQKMMQDIILAQEDLRAMKEVAERNANIKSEFLAHMSHEIRTPMNGVIGLLHLLLGLELEGKQLEYAEKTLASAQHLLRVVNDILDLSSIEKGRLKMEKDAFTIAEVCQATEDLFKPKADEKNVEFHITYSENTTGELFGDAFRLKQVLFNVTGNAIKFTESGSVNIDVQCKNETDTQKTLLFKITDTGIGLTQEQISKLFSAFSQAESFITRKYGGTGLGLLISKSIVEAMHGNIWVESEYGKSSTFFFTIVCDRFAEDEMRAKTAQAVSEQKALNEKDTQVIQEKDSTKSAPDTATSPVSSVSVSSDTVEKTIRRVLLVEDNKINQLIANELLKKHGYQTVLAENGQEALDILEKETFDVVLMDIQMPVMDGLTATKEIRKQSKFNNMPIIAVSAHTMEGDKELCLEHGMNDHVRKPISPPELFKAIDTCLAMAN